MTRSVPEWIGKSDDAKIPARVLVRVFEAHNGVCHISGTKITPGMKWEADHIIALCNGGEHRESNLAPALAEAHKQKTADDVKIKAKIARVKSKHLGVKKPSGKLKSRGFNRPTPNVKDIYEDVR